MRGIPCFNGVTCFPDLHVVVVERDLSQVPKVRQVRTTAVGLQHVSHPTQKVETIGPEAVRRLDHDELKANMPFFLRVPLRTAEGTSCRTQQLDHKAMIAMTFAEYGIATVFGRW